MAAPVCLLIPLSSWAAYFAMLMENEGITVNGSGMGAYLKALPFTFYAYLAVIVCVLKQQEMFSRKEQSASSSLRNHLRQSQRLRTHILGIS